MVEILRYIKLAGATYTHPNNYSHKELKGSTFLRGGDLVFIL